MTKSSRAGTILRRSLVLAPALVVLVVYALGPGGPVPLGPLAAVPVALAPAGGPAGAGAPPAAIAAPAGVPSPAPDPAAGAQPVPHGFSMAGHTARFDVRHLPPAASGHHREGGGEPEHEAPPVVLAQAGSLADVGSGTSLDASAPAPGPSSSFEGLAFDDACGATPCGDGHPPDTNGDVGPTYYIQAVNTAIGIFDKATGTRVAGFTFDAFMAQGHQGNLCDTDNFGDPVVLYDTFADRWIISDFAFQVDASGNVVSPPGSYQCIAVSQSGDPVSGGWSFYSVHVTDALQDYPKLGIWPDGLYLSANLFAFGGTQAFQNVRVWALNKAEMEAGQDAQVVSFDAPSKVQGVSVFGLLPANARLQAGAPPAGAPDDFASVWAWTNRVRVWKFHVDWANTGSSTFTGPFDSMTSTSWTTPPDTVPEKDGNALDTLAMRLMVQNQYSNIGGVESLWTTHTVAGSSASQAAIRWYQVPVTGGTVGNALQASTYNPDTRNRWMASAAVDRAGDMAIGYSVSDATIHPAIRYAGRLAGDPADAITQSETSLIQGGGAQSGNCGGAACERWGDYSAMTLDPDGCTFWYTNEYYASTGLNDHTRIGSFRFPSCQDVPLPSPTPTPSPVPTPTPTASPTPIPTPSPAPTPTPTATAAASPTATPAPPGVTKFWPDTGAVTNASPIVYELWFNVPVSGLASDDFIASGPATTGGTCSVSPSAVSSSEFLVSVTGCVDGSLGLQLKANSVSGNGTTGPSPAVSAPAITIDRTAPSVTVPVLSSVTVLPGAALTVTATAADIEGIAAADRNVAGAGWTFMTAVDGSWGGTSEALSSPVTAPATAGTYAVCVRATDNADNTSDGSACASLTVADFSVSASPTSRSVRQGDGGSFAIAIGRSGFASAVRLSATGLPPGANATFSPNPAPGGSATMAVTTSNCGTVTPRGTYTLTITGTDASGSTLHHATTVSMAVTNAPPTVGGPASTLYAGTKLGASSINVVTRWSACDPDGTRAYALRRQVDGGAWRTVSLSPATSTSVTEALARGSPYRYEVRATDRLGSSGAYSLGPSFTARATDQASSAVHYAGRWTTAAGSSAYGGSSRYATAPGASVSYTFSGTGIAWVSSRGPTRGSAAVYVDGVLRATVSLHSSTFSARATVFAASWATGGTHTIRIVVSGTSGHPRVDVDAFVRLTRA